VSPKLSSSAVAGFAVALAIAGCGGSQSATPVLRAADVTARAPGYRLSGTGTITLRGGNVGTVGMAMTGSFNRRDRIGTLTTVVDVGGRRIRVPELISQLTVYMASSALQGSAAVPGRKPWIKLDMSRAIAGAGISSLPTATDPTQFVDYLRAVSSRITDVGGATVRGVQTTHYRATVDLDRYPRLVAPSQRKAVAASVKNLEAALGSHTLPLEVWIDGHHLVRRLKLAFGECVSGAHFRFALSTDMYDYGPQPRPRIPPASQVYDLTPLVQAAMRRVHLGCGSH
jgi:hypothetical protein